MLAHRNFAFSGTLKRGFLVSPSIYPHVTTTLRTSSHANILRVKPNVNILAGRLSTIYNQMTTIRLSHHLPRILTRALTSYPGIRIIPNSILRVSLRTLFTSRFTNYSHLRIYTGLPCCVAAPILVHLLRDRLPVRQLIIVIRLRTTGHLYTPLNAQSYNTISTTIRCCARTRVLFRIKQRDFFPDPGMSSTIVTLAQQRRPPIRIASRNCFFHIIGNTFLRQHGALTGDLGTTLNIPGTRLATLFRSLKLDTATQTRRLAVSRVTTLTGTLCRGGTWGVGRERCPDF